MFKNSVGALLLCAVAATGCGDDNGASPTSGNDASQDSEMAGDSWVGDTGRADQASSPTSGGAEGGDGAQADVAAGDDTMDSVAPDQQTPQPDAENEGSADAGQGDAGSEGSVEGGQTEAGTDGSADAGQADAWSGSSMDSGQVTAADGAADVAADVVESGVVVVLSPECSDNNGCTVDTWNGTSCLHAPVPDGTPCDDGNRCTLGDQCQQGVCVSGAVSHGSLSEIGRVDAMGRESGYAVPMGDGRLLFVDPTASDAVLHVASVDAGAVAVEGAVYPGSGQPALLAPTADTAIYAGWPGFVAFASSYGDWVQPVTVDPSGAITVVPTFQVPLYGGMFGGEINGLAGSETVLWACVNYGTFFGSASFLYEYDLSTPSAPTLAAQVGLPEPCGSLATSADGARVYFNSASGIYWIAPAVVGDAGPIINGPFGTNSGLTMVGSTLVSRGASALALYSDPGAAQILQLSQAGLNGAAYLPDQNAVVVMVSDVNSGVYERWFELRDTSAADAGAVLDQVLLDRNQSGENAKLPTSGDVVLDPVTKAAFQVAGGKLIRLSTPMLGGAGPLSVAADGLSAFSATSWRGVNLSDAAAPALVGPGGPMVGHTHSLGVDLTAAPPRLIGDPDETNAAPERFPVSATALAAAGSVEITLRNHAWNQTTDTALVSLTGAETGTVQWAADSLYRLDTSNTAQARIRRWDSALLVASSGFPVPPSADVTLAVTGVPTGAAVGTRILDFPNYGSVGLVATTYTLTTDGGAYVIGAELLWIDRTASPLAIQQEVTVTGTTSPIVDCRLAGDRAVCVDSFDELVFVQRGPSPTVQIVTLSGDTSDSLGLLAFDGSRAYLSEDTALEVVAFGDSDAGLSGVSGITFSSPPVALAEEPNALVVASGSEIVAVSPQCSTP